MQERQSEYTHPAEEKDTDISSTSTSKSGVHNNALQNERYHIGANVFYFRESMCAPPSFFPFGLSMCSLFFSYVIIFFMS